jgi:hypothetical protein
MGGELSVINAVGTFKQVSCKPSKVLGQGGFAKISNILAGD